MSRGFLWRLEIIPNVVADTGANDTATVEHNNGDNTDDDVAIVGRRRGFGRGDRHFFRHDFSPI